MLINNSYTKAKNYHLNNAKFIGKNMYYRGMKVKIKTYDSSCFCWTAYSENDGQDITISTTQKHRLNY